MKIEVVQPETAVYAREPILREFLAGNLSHTRAFNNATKRTGALFESPFERKTVDSQRYLLTLIAYIHHNPQKHGFVDDFRDWPWTSYGAMLSDKPTKLNRDEVLVWYNGRSPWVGE